MEREEIKSLKRRYLVWLYKTTKEELDRIERKFTQLEIDRFILAELVKLDKDKELGLYLDEFRAYIQNKEKEGQELKYQGKDVKPGHLFLELKLKAIEKAIVEELGDKALDEIKGLYEKEMTERILKSTEH